MDSTLRAATLAAAAAADTLASTGARRGLFTGLVMGAAFGGFASLAFVGLGLPGMVFGALLGTALGSAIGGAIATKRGGWWRGILVALIPAVPALYLALGFLGPPSMIVVLFVLTAVGAGVGAWLDHSLDDLRLAAREASYRASAATE